MEVSCNFRGVEKIEQAISNVLASVETKILNVLKYAGETAVAYARQLNTYQDRTGNLRSSVGYVIYKNGQLSDRSGFEQGYRKEEIKANVEYNGSETGLALAQKVAQRIEAPFVLVVVAGMNYAAAVERRGYDVLTGASIEASEVAKRLIRGIKDGYATIELKDTSI